MVAQGKLHALALCRPDVCIQKDGCCTPLYDTFDRVDFDDPSVTSIPYKGYTWNVGTGSWYIDENWYWGFFGVYIGSNLKTSSSNASITYYKEYPQIDPSNGMLYANTSVYFDGCVSGDTATVTLGNYVYKHKYLDGEYLYKGDTILAYHGWSADYSHPDISIDTRHNRLVVNGLTTYIDTDDFTLALGTETNNGTIRFTGFTFNSSRDCAGYNPYCDAAQDNRVSSFYQVELDNFNESHQWIEGTYVCACDGRRVNFVVNPYYYGYAFTAPVEQYYNDCEWGYIFDGDLAFVPAETTDGFEARIYEYNSWEYYLWEADVERNAYDLFFNTYRYLSYDGGGHYTTNDIFGCEYINGEYRPFGPSEDITSTPTVVNAISSTHDVTGGSVLNFHNYSNYQEISLAVGWELYASGMFNLSNAFFTACQYEFVSEGDPFTFNDSLQVWDYHRGMFSSRFTATFSPYIGFVNRNYTVSYTPHTYINPYGPDPISCSGGYVTISGPREFYIYGERFYKTEDETIEVGYSSPSVGGGTVVYYGISGTLGATTSDLPLGTPHYLPVAEVWDEYYTDEDFNMGVSNIGMHLTTLPSGFTMGYSSFAPPTGQNDYAGHLHFDNFKWCMGSGVNPKDGPDEVRVVVNDNFYKFPQGDYLHLPHYTTEPFYIYYSNDGDLTYGYNGFQGEPIASGKINSGISNISYEYTVSDHHRNNYFLDIRPSGYRFSAGALVQYDNFRFYYYSYNWPRGFEHLPDSTLGMNRNVFTVAPTGDSFRICLPFTYWRDTSYEQMVEIAQDRYGPDTYKIPALPENTGWWYFYYVRNVEAYDIVSIQNNYYYTLEALREPLVRTSGDGRYALPVASVFYEYPDNFTLYDNRWEIQDDPWFQHPISGIYGLLAFNTDCQLRFDNNSGLVTIEPKRGKYYIYIDGNKIEKTTAETVSIPSGFYRVAAATNTVDFTPRQYNNIDQTEYSWTASAHFLLGFNPNGEFNIEPSWYVYGYPDFYYNYDKSEYSAVYHDCIDMIELGLPICMISRPYSVTFKNYMRASPDVKPNLQNMDEVFLDPRYPTGYANIEDIDHYYTDWGNLWRGKSIINLNSTCKVTSVNI